MKIGKLLAVAGLAYALDSVARGVYEDFGTAAFLTEIAVILTLVFGLFDWTYYDDVIRFALGLIGLLYFAGMIGALMAGRWGLAFAAAIFLYTITALFQPMVSSLLAWWDTPERRLEQRMEQACGYEYVYSPTDGYCYFDHEYHEDLLKTDNPNGHGYVERKVPQNWYETGPTEGALENIQRLKEQAAIAASEPKHGLLGSLVRVWWIGLPAIIWWTIKKLFGTPSKLPNDANRDSACPLSAAWLQRPTPEGNRVADAGILCRAYRQVLTAPPPNCGYSKNPSNMAGISVSRSSELCAMSFSRLRCSSMVGRSRPPS